MIRRFLLRYEFVMAAAGMHTLFSWRAGLEYEYEESKSTNTSKSRVRIRVRVRVRVSRVRAGVGVVRSSGSQYAAAGTAPPWPPLLKGGSLAQHNRRGKYRSSDREFSTGQGQEPRRTSRKTAGSRPRHERFWETAGAGPAPNAFGKTAGSETCRTLGKTAGAEWGVEKWAELTDFAVDDSAFSVAPTNL